MEKSLSHSIKEYKKQMQLGLIPKAYRGLIKYMADLRVYFINEYPIDYTSSHVYQGHMDITYFPFTPKSLKLQKLKIAIVFNHEQMRFEIWLVGQNRQIQKKYWEIFKDSDWKKYRIPSNLKEGFSIVDNILVENPNFDDLDALTKQIELGVMKFIKDIVEVLCQ